MKLAASVSIIAICALTSIAARADGYVVTPLTSDLPNTAPNQDPVLQNAWGVAFTPGGSPFWIADNATGCSTLYDGAGVPQPPANPSATPPVMPLRVSIPLPSSAPLPNPPATACMSVDPQKPPNPTPAAPTGMVWNPTSTFLVPGQQTPDGKPITAAFIWATEDGTISAWAGGLTPPNQAVLAVDNSGSGAVYKGLVFGTNAKGVFLFATNFNAGTVDVFGPATDSSNGMYVPVTTDGGFMDPDIPSGFAPFGIQNINGNLFVTYAKQKLPEKHDDQAGPGNGFVDIFDTSGNLIERFASQGTLNSPWGVSRASFAFGGFSGDILIGNFGDGRITAFGNDGTPHGLLLDAMTQNPLVIDGLWTITLGGGRNSDSDVLYFTAGPNGETDGLFGTITPQN